MFNTIVLRKSHVSYIRKSSKLDPYDKLNDICRNSQKIAPNLSVKMTKNKKVEAHRLFFHIGIILHEKSVEHRKLK